ncbi:MAG: M20/M25/M40 family metallo-hydrolase [Acidobacteria bacterium]|nr:M20/M25/M40 family metallo-hydrolase [Acidobacteriota bacterium]
MPNKTVTSAQQFAEQQITEIMHARWDRLVRIIGDLVEIPSENTPPFGYEQQCQEYVHDHLRALDIEAELYNPLAVAGLSEHPAFKAGRDYTNRPNVAALWPGSGGGRSLLISGHIDTVPHGSEPWQRDPFTASVEDNRLYGLGSNDMKGGIGCFLLAVEALKEAGVRLRGDLLLETIVDEEFGGVNGTLAARVRGANAEAAIICEPSQTMICPAQTGGRTAHIKLHSDHAGILYEGEPPVKVTEQLHYLLGSIEAFAQQRRAHTAIHPLYADDPDPVPVWVTKISCGGWGTSEPITIPSNCKVELYWQCMPGETQEEVESQFFSWLEDSIAQRPNLFPVKPEVDFPIRWLPGSVLAGEPQSVTLLKETFEDVTGVKPIIRGIGGPCDLFLFHQHFDTPAVLFGPRGGNTHSPDEWVDLDSALVVAETLAHFICRWCGVER